MTGATLVGAIFIALAFGGILGSVAAISVSESRVVLAALFAQVAVGNQFAMLDAWYKAGGRYPLGVTLRQFARLLEFGALIGAVLLGGRPGAAAGAFLAGSVVGLIVSALVLRRAVPWVSFRPVKPDLRTFRGLLAPGVAFLAFPLGTVMSVQGLTLAIGLTLGPPAVVVFNTARTMTRAIPQALHSINLSVGPEMSRAFGAGQVNVARTIQRRAVQLSLALSVMVALALAVAGQGIIKAWTGGLVVAPIDLLVILLLVVLASSTWFPLAIVLVATNRHTRMALIYFVSTSVAVLLAVPLSTAFGLVGAAFALLGIDILMTLYVIPAALGAVDDTPGEFVRALLDVRGALVSLRHGTAGLSRRSLERPPSGGGQS
jgi:O-antigen/teichoic acid export membrane protein